MAKGKKSKQAKKAAAATRQAVAKPVSRETRAADVVTVLWTQSAVLATLCNLGAAIVVVLARYNPDSTPLSVLWRVLLFGACVGGISILGLTRPVFRLRRDPPPTSITVFAIAMAITPIIAGIIISLRGGE